VEQSSVSGSIRSEQGNGCQPCLPQPDPPVGENSLLGRRLLVMARSSSISQVRLSKITLAASRITLISSPLPDTLFLASYFHAPDANTPFTYPPATVPPSPTKKSTKVRPISEAPAKRRLPPPIFFSIDKILPYNAFFADFGPLHIGHMYRFAVMLHELLSQLRDNTPIVLWSYAHSRSECSFSLSKRNSLEVCFRA
jgi:hypothetical protein